jgi:hypothetical protein
MHSGAQRTEVAGSKTTGRGHTQLEYRFHCLFSKSMVIQFGSSIGHSGAP